MDGHKLLLRSFNQILLQVPHDMSIVTDYYDLIQVSLTFVQILRHPYKIPSILFEITMCLYEFIRVLHDQSPVCTI